MAKAKYVSAEIERRILIEHFKKKNDATLRQRLENGDKIKNWYSTKTSVFHAACDRAILKIQEQRFSRFLKQMDQVKRIYRSVGFEGLLEVYSDKNERTQSPSE